MGRTFVGVLAAAVLGTVATIGAQAPAQAKPDVTVTGCLQKASSGGYTLASDSKSGATGTSGSSAAKGSYSLVGVSPPGLKLDQLVNKKLEVVSMEFGGMIPALIASKVDMIGACITITEERKKSVLFSESYYKGGISALVKQ